jgi:predicted RNase H-like HicB family nuclease
MHGDENHFEFTAATIKEGRWYVSLCLDLDVASQGRSIRAAKKMLAEAVSLYLETCFESNVPYLRPVPKKDDPRFTTLENLIEIFPLKVDFQVHAVA